MPLTVDDPEIDKLVEEMAEMTGESTTDVVRRALLERRERLQSNVETRERIRRALEYLQFEVWPLVPPEQLGRPLSRIEENELLGHGPIDP